MASFAEKLRELRIQRNLGQKELGAVIGVSDSSIRKYESGDRTPNPDAITKLANYFGVSTDELLGSNTTESSNNKAPKDLARILAEHEIMFSGTPLDEEDKKEIYDLIQFRQFRRAKELNKRKPKNKED